MVITSFVQLQVLQEIPLNTSFVDEQGEWWRNVTYPGYEKRYLVGNFGHIYGISEHKVLEVSLHPKKYQGLVLYDGAGHCMFRKIHVIVARRFCTDGLPKGVSLGWDDGTLGYCVNHIDEDPTNNRADNLEFVSAGDNDRYGQRSVNSALHRMNARTPLTEKEKIQILNRSYSKRAKPVVQYTFEGRFVRVFKSIAQASEYTGVPANGISNCCSHSRGYTQSGGFRWEYFQQ